MSAETNGPDEQKESVGDRLPSDHVPDELMPDGGFSEERLPASLAKQLAAAWDKREPKWYERLAPAQKHWVDKLVAIRLQEFEAHLSALDREDSQLSRQIAEVSAQLGQLNRRLADLEKRIDRLESRATGDAPSAGDPSKDGSG